MDYAKEYDRMVEQSNQQQERISDLEQARAICPECAKRIDEAAGIDLFSLKEKLTQVEEERDARDGLVCDQCIDGSGWCENAVEGRYPCTCMTEAEPYQMLQQQLAASQAREQVLRRWIIDSGMVAESDPINYALSTPSDDTALREYVAKLLEEMAVELGVCEHKCDMEVRNKAAELRSGK